MSETKQLPPVPLYYPGHYGEEPTTQFRDLATKIVWDQAIKFVPAAAAAGLVRYNGFARVATPGEVCSRFGVMYDDLAGAIELGSIHVEHHQPEGEGADSVEYVVLDRKTVLALRKLSAASAPTDTEN